jgi:Lrp/AsnC family transcriptional regulator, leucine-responsive regulatory protein
MAIDPKLDDTDWKLLEALQEDARLSYAELGRRLALSPPAVTERVRRLETLGVVTGYRAMIDPERVGLGIQATIRLVISSSRECLTIGDRLRDVPEVLECYRVTGADSHVLRVACRSIRHLDEVIARIMPESGETVTSVVLSTPVPWHPVTRSLAEGSPEGSAGG